MNLITPLLFVLFEVLMVICLVGDDEKEFDDTLLG